MTIKELYEKKGFQIEAMKTLSLEVRNASDATIAKEKSDAWNKADNDYVVLVEQIRIAEASDLLDAESANPVETKTTKTPNTREEMFKSPEYEKAFAEQLRTGKVTGKNIEVMQRASVFNTSDATGGYTIPETFAKRVLLATVYFGGMLDRNLLNWFSTKDGGTWNLPAANDTAQEGYVVTEVEDMNTNATNITLTNITLSAYQYTSGLVKISKALIQDSGFDFMGWLADTLAIRYWRGINTLLTTGSGNSTLAGVMTGSHQGEAAVKRGLSRDDLLNLYHELDPSYRNSPFCRWMMNDATLKILKAIVQSATYNESPLWQPSMRVGEPDTIEGKPYIVNQAMDDVFPTKKPIVFGDFKQFYVREVLPMQTIALYERFADTNQIGFALLGRYDSVVAAAATSYPFVHIRNATT